MQLRKFIQILITGFLLMSFCFGNSSMAQQITPVADSPQLAGAAFTVDIRVENVERLFGVSFVLHYTHNTDYIDVLSAMKGDFLGNDVIFLDPVINDSQGTISIGITRKRPAKGVNGSGVVARVIFKSESATPNGTSVDFTITDIVANEPSGAAIQLTPLPLKVTLQRFSSSAIIKPVVDTLPRVNAAFTVDIRVENVENLFGVSFVLHYTHNTDYINALSVVKGDFLGNDIIFLDPVINDSQGTVSVGITRKRPADGVDGSGVVATVIFKSKPATPDGTYVDFTITDIVVNNPSGAAIPLTSQPLNMIIASDECMRGDVNGDGMITPYDAFLILRFVVGLIDKFPADASPSSSRQRNYSISVPHITVAMGNRINVPISINDMSGITSGGIALRYEPNVLRAVNVFTSDMLSGYYWESNIKRKGEVRIAFTGAPQALSGENTLFYVEFEVLPNNNYGVSPLILDIVQLSESLNINKINGSITILPKKTRLLQNYPNPFNPETWIPYQLAQEASIRITIYNTKGQLVRTLNLGEKPASSYISKSKAAYWDGRDNLGQKVASGIYFYTLQVEHSSPDIRLAATLTATRRMMIVK